MTEMTAHPGSRRDAVAAAASQETGKVTAVGTGGDHNATATLTVTETRQVP
jgi:hypothetical protein